MVESIKSENDLRFLLKTFNNSLIKKILILKFSEKDLNKINSINHVIDIFEKENKMIKNKLIIFIIHRQRYSKFLKNKRIIPESISFINDDFYQIFIDNLQGKQNLDIFKIASNQEIILKEFMKETNLLDNNIYTILNYIKINILNENKDLNMKNFIPAIAEKIINNEIIKKLIIQNLEKQGESIKGIIKEVFISDIVEINDVDFFEVINSKLKNYFCLNLLNIIFYTLKENILLPILNNNNLEFLIKNEFFKDLIIKEFDKTSFNFIPAIKMAINANKLIIYNGLLLPKSKYYIEKINNFINELDLLEYNIKVEIKKFDYK